MGHYLLWLIVGSLVALAFNAQGGWGMWLFWYPAWTTAFFQLWWAGLRTTVSGFNQPDGWSDDFEGWYVIAIVATFLSPFIFLIF